MTTTTAAEPFQPLGAQTKNPPILPPPETSAHSRAQREVSAFSSGVSELRRTAQPAPSPTTDLDLFRVLRGGDGTYQLAHVTKLTGRPQVTENLRPGKFPAGSAKADQLAPSEAMRQLCAGEGIYVTWPDKTVWESALLRWAKAVQATPYECREASRLVALALATRAGMALSIHDLPF